MGAKLCNFHVMGWKLKFFFTEAWKLQIVYITGDNGFEKTGNYPLKLCRWDFCVTVTNLKSGE